MAVTTVKRGRKQGAAKIPLNLKLRKRGYGPIVCPPLADSFCMVTGGPYPSFCWCDVYGLLTRNYGTCNTKYRAARKQARARRR